MNTTIWFRQWSWPPPVIPSGVNNLHAILINEDQSLVWSKVPDPVIKGNDILIEVHAAALNRADLMQRAGNYPPPPGWPEWMGLEVTGIVLETPPNCRWKAGDTVCALLGGGGYIAMDCVAGPDLGACLKTMARGGRWIVIATLSGSHSELDMTDFFKRGIKLIGSTLRSRTAGMKADILAGLEEKLWALLSTGKIKVWVHKSLPITRAEEAQAILQNQENLGKVVLVVK